ncbi:MAG: hypothetical protein ACOC4J_03085 [Bacteroidota bacterium]
MKKICIVIAVLGLFWINNLYSQPIRCGVITHLEDSIHHHYVGIFIFQVIHEVYSTPFDLKTPLAQMTMNQLAQQYPHVEFVKIDETHYREHLAFLEEFSGRRVLRRKRLEWFETMKEKYDIANLLVISHVPVMYDIITHSRYPIYGYGIYNSVHPGRSAVYINMERYFFDETKVSNSFARNNLLHIDDLPRIIKQNVYFNEEELLMLEPHILRLIEKQVWELLWDSKLTQEMTRAFGKAGGE